MYTVDYLKTLHADYVEWNTDPGFYKNLLKQYNKWEKRKWEIKELVEMTSKSDKVFDQKGKN